MSMRSRLSWILGLSLCVAFSGLQPEALCGARTGDFTGRRHGADLITAASYPTASYGDLGVGQSAAFSDLRVTLSDTVVSFGPVSTETTYSLPMTITNHMSVPVQVLGAVFEESVFSSDLTPVEIAAEEDHSFNICFSSQHNVIHTDFLRIELSEGVEPLLAKVSAQAHHVDTYDSLTFNKWAEDLKAALHGIIDEHNVLSYDAARDNMYGHIDNDSSCTECPETGCVECVYTGRIGCFNTRAGANDNSFNCEHTWPSSFFCTASPMYTDIFHLYPTDSNANNIRGNLDFGVVTTPNWSQGGSKRGLDLYGQDVFEPRDAHKGNLARTHFYFTVRYAESRRDSCSSYVDAAKMEAHFRNWHVSDPVDSAEQQRNEDICALQLNRNPFIDHPEFVDRISSFFSTATAPAAPEIAVAPGRIDMGEVGLDTTTSYGFAIINTGSDTLLVSSITSSDPDFKVDTLGLTLPPESYEYVMLTYTSGDTELTDSTIIQIVSNDSDEVLVDIPAIIDVVEISGVLAADLVPAAVCLYQNHPNPFTRTTEIRYGIPRTAHVRVSIYNTLGERVVTLVDQPEDPGHKLITWDAGNQSGGRVAPGLYFVRIEAAGFVDTKKAVLLE